MHSGKLYYADIGENPEKIIDLGTGTGIWAVDGGLTKLARCYAR